MTEEEMQKLLKLGRKYIQQREGVKYDSGKLEWDLLPIKPLEYVVKVLMFGKAKYGEDNWQQVPDGYKRYRKAALRHAMSLVSGEWLDEESQLPHAAHCICCLIFLIWFKQNEKNVD